MKNRLIGLVLFLAGAVLAYFCIYLPLAEAAHHEKSVSLSLKGVILCPIGVVFGFFYMIMGDRAKELFGERKSPTPFSWICGIGLIAAGFLAYWAVKSSLEQSGYKF